MMPRFRRWRRPFWYSAAVIVTLCGLVAGFAAAAEIINGSGAGSASTGTVAVRVSTLATRSCHYSLLLPGDLTGATTCTMSIEYTGTIPAYLSLTVRIQSKAGTGGSPLYDGTNADGLTLTISDGHRTFTVPTGTGTTGGSCPAGFTCWKASNDLAATYSGSTPGLVFSRGDDATFTLTPRFLGTVGNSFQGGTANVTLSEQAVQAPANPPPPTCNLTTIGQPCPPSGTFTWS